MCGLPRSSQSEEFLDGVERAAAYRFFFPLAFFLTLTVFLEAFAPFFGGLCFSTLGGL